MTSSSIFTPISSDPPPANIAHRTNHPVPRLGISAIDQKSPIETNKFYANFFLGSQGCPIFPQPYSLQWSKGTGNAKSWGLAISHTEANQLALGDGDPARYYLNPIGVHSLIMSAAELGPSTTLTVDTIRAFSANAHLSAAAGGDPTITFPMLQGMGFISAIYRGATPLIQSSVFFRSLSRPVTVGSSVKFAVVLEDNQIWLIYVTRTSGNANPAGFTLVDNTTIRGPAGFYGSIQVAKNPAGADGEAVYDRSAGTFALSANISASVSNDGTTATYTLRWTKFGTKPLVMFALPHHVESFDAATQSTKTCIQLRTTTKGVATAIIGDKMTMIEPNLPVDMHFAPWTPEKGSVTKLPPAAATAVANAASKELQQDMLAQSNLDSMYFAGKALAKFAFILFATRYLSDKPDLATAGLAKLKAAFARFVDNKQINPLVYDESWKGVISTGGYEDSGVDFGNTNFNDHHFHYGYFVYAAAVIAYMDPAWLSQGTNKAWVQMLVQDYANSYVGDYYPFSRSFDWWHGHSWAKGLYESGDGKDEESTSEDAFASYALRMWGRVLGDRNMEARGTLMLAIQARTFHHHFLMEASNVDQPARFIGNKVTGILFENKCDHATYFGIAPEFIQGIHMIPLGPASTYTRRPRFVQEEWDAYFSDGRADDAQDGWRGLLYANYALVDPRAAYAFFAAPDFNEAALDGGASLTWYLAWCAGLGGC